MTLRDLELEYVKAKLVTIQPGERQTLVVNPPAGKTMISAGGFTFGAYGDLYLEESCPHVPDEVEEAPPWAWCITVHNRGTEPAIAVVGGFAAAY